MTSPNPNQRGRASGVTGDYLETDPACSYIPQAA
jgi:hypothetical protein